MIPLGVFLLYAAYEVVAAPLYLRIVYVLFCKQEFRDSPLYRFVAIIGVLEIAHYAVICVFYRLPMFAPTAAFFGTLTDPSRFLSLAGFAMFFLRYLSIFLHIVLALNRVTAVWMPIKYDEIWCTNWRFVAICAFLISFALPFDRLCSASCYVALITAKPEIGGYTLIAANYDFYILDQNMLTVIASGIGIISCILLNGLTFLKIFAFKRQLSGMSAQSVSDRKVEINLFIMTMWMTFSLIFLSGFQTMLFVVRNGALASSFFSSGANSSDVMYMLFLQFPWVEDLSSLSEPWALLLTNETLRKAVLPMLFDLTAQSAPNSKINTNTTQVIPMAASPHQRVHYGTTPTVPRRNNFYRGGPSTIP